MESFQHGEELLLEGLISSRLRDFSVQVEHEIMSFHSLKDGEESIEIGYPGIRIRSDALGLLDYVGR